jgi:hypothetical protein
MKRSSSALSNSSKLARAEAVESEVGEISSHAEPTSLPVTFTDENELRAFLADAADTAHLNGFYKELMLLRAFLAYKLSGGRCDDDNVSPRSGRFTKCADIHFYSQEGAEEDPSMVHYYTAIFEPDIEKVVNRYGGFCKPGMRNGVYYDLAQARGFNKSGKQAAWTDHVKAFVRGAWSEDRSRVSLCTEIYEAWQAEDIPDAGRRDAILALVDSVL